MTSREDLLTQILDCRIADLSLIDNVKYDWCDILEAEKKSCQLNRLMRQVFHFGYNQIEQAVNDRICELEAIPNERELAEDEEQELEVLRKLEPQQDFDSLHNYLDTRVWVKKNGEAYRKYLSDALDEFADGTGFKICSKIL